MDEEDPDFDDIPAKVEVRLPLSSVANWAPPDFVEWMRSVANKCPVRPWNLYVRLLSDDRMLSVWAWHDSARFGAPMKLYQSGLSLAMSVERALRFPSKPGNMTPKKREEYFRKIRYHTDALLRLIEDTPFASNSLYWSGRKTDPIDEDELAEQVVRDLWSWKDDEPPDGHIVAYVVNSDGVSRLPWTFPDSHLYDFLIELLDWTRWDDGWGDLVTSSNSIAHANTANARTIFFNCTLFVDLDGKGISIPFAHLATLANVALELAPDKLVDEDTARKQVRRFQARHKQESSPPTDGVF